MQNSKCTMQGARFNMPKVLIFAFCIAVTSEASATVLLPADFATVVTESQTIVHGRVIAVHSSLTAPAQRIESVVTLATIEALKGASGPTLSFRVPYGQVGRYRRILVGAPEFAEGDEVIVFLQGRAPAMPSLFGLSQGVYRIRRDASQAIVSPSPPAASDGRLVRGDPARRPQLLDAFTRGLHEILERGR
jgi:hypothetical protein